MLCEEGAVNTPDKSRIGADNKSYKMDLVEQAEDLYCARGRSFESISMEMESLPARSSAGRHSTPGRKAKGGFARLLRPLESEPSLPWPIL